jgi:hypothetical protein
MPNAKSNPTPSFNNQDNIRACRVLREIIAYNLDTGLWWHPPPSHHYNFIRRHTTWRTRDWIDDHNTIPHNPSNDDMNPEQIRINLSNQIPNSLNPNLIEESDDDVPDLVDENGMVVNR